MSKFILIICILIVFTLLMLALHFVKKYREKAIELLKQWVNAFFWNGVLKSLTISYL